MARSFRIESTVRGHHIYKTHWRPDINEELCCEVERENFYDRYAVAVMKDGGVVGHVPQDRAEKNMFLLSSKATQQDALRDHWPQKIFRDPWKRAGRSLYIRLHRQSKAHRQANHSFNLTVVYVSVLFVYVSMILFSYLHVHFYSTLFSLHTCVNHKPQLAREARRGGVY